MQVKLIALVIILTFEKSVEFKETLHWMAQFIQRLLATPEVRGLNTIRDINDQHLKAKPYWGSHWLFLVGYLTMTPLREGV